MDDYDVSSSGNQNWDRRSSGQGSNGSSGNQTTQGQWNAQTTAYKSASPATPTATPRSQTNLASPSSAPSTSSGLSSSDRNAIIGGVLGCAGGLLVISLIAIYLLQRRKTAQKCSDHQGVTQQVSYNGLNSSFAGVPFLKRQSRAADIEIAPPPMVADTSYHGAYMKGGQSDHPDLASDRETDWFLPNDEATQQRMSGGVNGFHSQSNSLISPQDPFTDQNRLSQMTQMSQMSQSTICPNDTSTNNASPNNMSLARPGPLIRHDTMGFPLDDEDTSYIGTDGQQHDLSRVIHSPLSSIGEAAVISPAPIHLTASQESLERGAWQNQNQPQHLDSLSSDYDNPIQPQHLNSLSSNYDNPYQFENEQDVVSPIDSSYVPEQCMSPASMLSGTQPSNAAGAWIAAQNHHLAAEVAGHGSGGSFMGGLRRNVSQMTQSSFAPSVISDTELDRLGVGQRRA